MVVLFVFPAYDVIFVFSNVTKCFEKMTAALPSDLLIGGKYAITSDGDRPGILGEGSFGAVYKGMDVSIKAAVAIKMEHVDARYPQLAYEHKVLEELKGTPGIPKVLFYGAYERTHNAMVMERLGQTVGAEGPLTPHTIAHVARCVLGILRMVHLAGIVHRDMKPENLLWAKGTIIHRKEEVRAQVYLIDFGLCKRVLGEDGRHISDRKDKALVGTPEFAALRAHQGGELSRRDDIESLVYVLLFLFSNKLPWQKEFLDGDTEEGKEQDSHYSTMGARKTWALQDVDARLLQHLPTPLLTALRATLIYARAGLKFTDMPNFDLLEKYWSTPGLL